MKNATTYARKIKRLLGKIRKEAQKDPAVEVNGVTETLLLGILSRSTTQKRAADALSRLVESTVDLNDLRVTPVAEMVQIIGVRYPRSRPVCEEVSQVLAGIFNQVHELDLSFLKALGKKAAATFLESLDGLSPHANAFFTLRYLNFAAVALDETAHEYLVKTGHLPDGTDILVTHKFLRTHIKESEAGVLSAALKIHARSSEGKKEMRAAASAGASAASKKTRAISKKTTVKKTTTTETTAGAKASRADSAGSPPARKKAPRKKHRR